MSTLKLLKEIRESGDKTPYASLLKQTREAKKAHIFVESPEISSPKYNLSEKTKMPENLDIIRKNYFNKTKEIEDFQKTRPISYINYLANYITGYYGEDNIPIYLNWNNLEDEFNKIATEKDKQRLLDIKKLSDEYHNKKSELFQQLYSITEQFNKLNPVVIRKDSTFIEEGNKLKEFYNKKGIDADVIPLYGLQDTTKINNANIISQDDVAIFGHSGKKFADIPNSWWNSKISSLNPDKCLLGTCRGDDVIESLPNIKNLYRTKKQNWQGVNPHATSIENAMFSTSPTHEQYLESLTTIKPQRGVNYEINNEYKKP